MSLALVLSIPFFAFAAPANLSPNVDTKSGCVTLYEHANFQGRAKRFCGDTSYVGNDFNDIASSVKVDCSVNSVTLFEHANYQGRYVTYHGCQKIGYVGNSFNDIISSLAVD
ncbi:hypothetical protein DL897_08810 [Thermoflavimicrobium daqui]|uniref:Beta/gamma crystallin 'Greek key' domain-containing protein n=2 Tax=Thermoflavimicrobium daqui TaxID=2137476 RepID=A0A364K5H3_9BACL|nr:hypothetical protein DL897_08810 [Thermoflavimicrobium daqui]